MYDLDNRYKQTKDSNAHLGNPFLCSIPIRAVLMHKRKIRFRQRDAMALSTPICGSTKTSCAMLAMHVIVVVIKMPVGNPSSTCCSYTVYVVDPKFNCDAV